MCFRKFLDDDIRELNLKVLHEYKDKHFGTILHDEKNKVINLVKKAVENKMHLKYSFYSECTRNRFIDYSVRKFGNFIIKNIYHIIKIGYLPDPQLLSEHQFKRFIKIYAQTVSKTPIANINKLSFKELKEIAGIYKEKD